MSARLRRDQTASGTGSPELRRRLGFRDGDKGTHSSRTLMLAEIQELFEATPAGAVRGTIIATSKYSKGTRDAAFEPGAAPITLIDGEKLIDLLITHGIGVRKKTLEVLELNASAFAEVEESMTESGGGAE